MNGHLLTTMIAAYSAIATFLAVYTLQDVAREEGRLDPSDVAVTLSVAICWPLLLLAIVATFAQRRTRR